MIVCDICRKDVAVLERDQRVFGLLPIEVSQFSYKKAEWQWIDADDCSGMSYFLHGSCLDRMVGIARQNDKPYQQPQEKK